METGIIILLITFVLTFITLAFIPYMTRKTENFGVTIPEKHYQRADFLAMRKKYTAILLAIGILFSAIIIYSMYLFSKEMLYIISTGIIFLYIFISFFVYLPFHFKMKKIKGAEQWYEKEGSKIIVDMKFRDEKLTLSNWWFIIPCLIFIATIAVTIILYDKIPAQIPMHTDFSGNVTYDEKTWTNLLFLPGTQLFILLLFIGINAVIKYSKQQVSAEHPERSKKQNIIFRRRWSAFLIGMAILMQLLFFYIQLSFIYPKLEDYVDYITGILLFFIIIGSLILSITTGQGGSRIKIKDQTNSDVIDRDDDRYWKLGQFYVNRNDPAIFIEKRFGVGWTNNWAHPLSWIIILGIIAIPVIITILFS